MEQEIYGQDSFNMKQILALSHDKVYEASDLVNDKTLDQALRLFILLKFGQEELHTRISPYMKYDKLSPAISK